MSGTSDASASVLDAAEGFQMDGELGFILTTGNTRSTSLIGKIDAHQELAQWSNDYVLETFYKQEEVSVDGSERQSKTTAQKFFSSAQGNYKLNNPDHRLFAYASYEDDRFNSYRYRATLSVGWNAKWWEDDISRFSYSIGPGYAFSETSEGKDVSGVIMRGQIDYRLLLSDTAVLKQILSVEKGELNSKTRSETSLSTKVNGALSMKIGLMLNHNTHVQPGDKKLDTETSVTMVYTFF